MGKIILVTGGARCGKSTFGLEYVVKNATQRVFIATATTCDSEMELRIANHKKERGNTFMTIEEPYNLAQALGCVPAGTNGILVDCLTVWLGNMFYKHGDDNYGAVDKSITELVASVQKVQCTCVFITNEVGMGIVPDSALCRNYRDLCGTMNRKMAGCADEVYFCVSGIPMKIK